jgi:hypothetical protein
MWLLESFPGFWGPNPKTTLPVFFRPRTPNPPRPCSCMQPSNVDVCPSCPWPSGPPSAHEIFPWFCQTPTLTTVVDVVFITISMCSCSLSCYVLSILGPSSSPLVPWSKYSCLVFTIHGPSTWTPRLTFSIVVNHLNVLNLAHSQAKRHVAQYIRTRHLSSNHARTNSTKARSSRIDSNLPSLTWTHIHHVIS